MSFFPREENTYVSGRTDRRVKTLVIDTWRYGELHTLKYNIQYFSFASKPSMKLLMDTRLSKWNILRLDQLQPIDTATIEQIVTIFSAVTDLKFMTIDSKHIDTLVSLLQHPNWQCQLTNLMVDGTYAIKSQLAGELITAITDLTALQHLALEWDHYTDLPDLPILAQLKTVVLESERLDAFQRSFERNAADNVDLEVYLFTYDTEALFTLSQPLRSRIVCYGCYQLEYSNGQVSLFCSHFRSLTSLTLWPIRSTEIGRLFSDLSQLHQLIHLRFEVKFSEVEEELPAQALPLVQLNSLRALELDLEITSHSQIEWLNLPKTMPNLKTIYIWRFNCGCCKVRLEDYKYDSSLIGSPPALGCYRSSLFNLHPGVPLKRFILNSYVKPTSAEELLLQSQ